jgi:hypothetical protein
MGDCKEELMVMVLTNNNLNIVGYSLEWYGKVCVLYFIIIRSINQQV